MCPEPPSGPNKIPARRRSHQRALILLALFGAGLGFLFLSSRSRLREGRSDLLARIAAYRAQERQIVELRLGDEPVDAADTYRGLVHLLEPGLVSSPPPKPQGVDFDRIRALVSRPDTITLRDRLRRRVSPSPSPRELEAVRAYRPLVEAIRKAAYSRRCRWRYPFEKGLMAENWILTPVTSLGNMMAYESYAAADPDEALTRALEMQIIGRDFYRHPDHARAVTGLRFIKNAFLALEAALERPVSARALRQALELLKGLRPLDTARRIEADDLAMGAQFCAIAGIPLDRSLQAEESCALIFPARKDRWKRPLLMSAVGVNRAWGEHRARGKEARAILELPPRRRRAAWSRLRARERERWVYSVHIPGSRSPVYRARFLARRRMLILLVAAQLFLREHGRFPDTLTELEPCLSLPADPFRDDGGPFGYENKLGELTLRSMARELVVRGRAPKPR